MRGYSRHLKSSRSRHDEIDLGRLLRTRQLCLEQGLALGDGVGSLSARSLGRACANLIGEPIHGIDEKRLRLHLVEYRVNYLLPKAHKIHLQIDRIYHDFVAARLLRAHRLWVVHEPARIMSHEGQPVGIGLMSQRYLNRRPGHDWRVAVAKIEWQLEVAVHRHAKLNHFRPRGKSAVDWLKPALAGGDIVKTTRLISRISSQIGQLIFLISFRFAECVDKIGLKYPKTHRSQPFR